MTIGEKIRKVRQLYGYTQGELALISELPLGTIKQYESNRRIPKEFQLNQIAKALGITIEYLTNHNIESYNDVKHTLLELEDTFGLKVTEIEGNCVLQFNDMQLSDFLSQWLTAKQGSNTSSETLKEYELWKTTYPLIEEESMAKKLRAKRKELFEE